MSSRLGIRVAALLCLCLPACTVSLPDPLFSERSFIVKGTFENRELPWGAGTVGVWVDQTGVVYHLFQGEEIANEDFDRITTPGVTSRLQLTPRADLQVGNQIGTKVVVDEVLEIVN